MLPPYLRPLLVGACPQPSLRLPVLPPYLCCPSPPRSPLFALVWLQDVSAGGGRAARRGRLQQGLQGHRCEGQGGSNPRFVVQNTEVLVRARCFRGRAWTPCGFPLPPPHLPSSARPLPSSCPLPPSPEETTGRQFALKRMTKGSAMQCPEHVYSEQEITRNMAHPFCLRQYASFQVRGVCCVCPFYCAPPCFRTHPLSSIGGLGHCRCTPKVTHRMWYPILNLYFRVLRRTSTICTSCST